MLDASVWLSIVVGALEADVIPETAVAVPGHFDVEVTSGLRGLVRGGRLDADAGEAWAEALRMAPLLRVATRDLSDVWRLSSVVSAYDAPYVALAARERAPLLTCDARLARGAADECDARLVPSRAER